jgi:hypothetical protein
MGLRAGLAEGGGVTGERRSDTPHTLAHPTWTPWLRGQVVLGPVSQEVGYRVGEELGRRGGVLRSLRLYSQNAWTPWLEVELTGASAAAG